MTIKTIYVKSPTLSGIMYDGTNIDEIEAFVNTGKNKDEWCFNSDSDDVAGYALDIGHWAVMHKDGRVYNYSPERFEDNLYVGD